MTSTSVPNLQADYWNGDEAVHWLAHEDRYESMLGPFTPRLLAAVAVSSSDRVLDIGCGCGATTRAAARAARAGQALGVDLSEPLLRRAAERAEEEGLVNVRFEQADAEVHPLPEAAFDAVMSRFGVMFFTDPGAAFAHVVRALRPGGRLAFVCWQGALENEWVTVPGLAVAEHVALPALDDAGGPGPFSLAAEARVRAVLGTAGCVEVDLQPVTEPLCLGADLADTVAFLKDTGMGRAALQATDPPTTARATRALQSALEPYLTPEGIRVGSAAWLVTGRRPT